MAFSKKSGNSEKKKRHVYAVATAAAWPIHNNEMYGTFCAGTDPTAS
jgi:hypothetical protein